MIAILAHNLRFAEQPNLLCSALLAHGPSINLNNYSYTPCAAKTMSDFSIDQNGKFRILNADTLKETQDLVSSQYLSQIETFLNTNQSNLSTTRETRLAALGPHKI